MDRIRHRLPLLTMTIAVILCTCVPWGVRAEFEAADSVNLAAIESAVSSYLVGIHQSVNSINTISDSYLPNLAPMKSELVTMRLATSLILAEAEDQTAHLSHIRDDADYSASRLYDIDKTLDTMSNLMVNQPYNLQQIVNSSENAVDKLGDAVTSLDGIDTGIESVDSSIDDLTTGLSGQNAYVEDWGEWDEFSPADIDDEVTPYEDGQTILDRGGNLFRSAFSSFLREANDSSQNITDFFPLGTSYGVFGAYLNSAPRTIPLTTATNILGYPIPAISLDWTPVFVSPIVSQLRYLIGFILIGMFALSCFHRLAAFL